MARHPGYLSSIHRSFRHPAGCLAASVILSLVLSAGAAISADTATPSGGAPRIVNITSDSAPGWRPSEDLEHQVRKTATDYMADMDSGRYDEAYTFLADIDRKDQPLSTFSDRLRQFNARAGAVIERRIVTVTWTKDPAHAPLPGVYAALDLVSRFANIDRHCGFLVLYQAPSGGGFQVMREENNFLDNAAAASIAQRSSPAAVEETWAKVYVHCPGYQPVMSTAAQSVPVAPPAPLPEVTGMAVGYPTVDAALASLHSNPGVVFTNQGGWTVAQDDATKTIWSFPPQGHPAYPSVVKRQLVQQGGDVNLDMNVQCESTKIACDDLVRSFEQLNAQTKASMGGH
jgi:hypothetical protein